MRPTIRATWTARSFWRACRRGCATGSRRRWPRSFSSRISFPEQYGRKAWFTNSLNYYLAALFFNAFPLPQREAGARQTLRYIGEVLESGFSVLIFPEGRRHATGEIDGFRPGIGMIASRLGVPVVPVRLEGLDKVLHPSWKMAKPGRVRVAFGAPMRLSATTTRRWRSRWRTRSRDCNRSGVGLRPDSECCAARPRSLLSLESCVSLCRSRCGTMFV